LEFESILATAHDSFMKLKKSANLAGGYPYCTAIMPGDAVSVLSVDNSSLREKDTDNFVVLMPLLVNTRQTPCPNSSRATSPLAPPTPPQDAP
jgi:hypothetical protein